MKIIQNNQPKLYPESLNDCSDMACTDCIIFSLFNIENHNKCMRRDELQRNSL